MNDRAARQFLRWRDRGDAVALAAVFDRTSPELLRLAMHLCGNVADAEDLLQGTFLTAIQSAASFERGRRLMPWLVAILTHAAHAERRRRLRTRPDAIEPDALASREPDPGHEAVQQETLRATLAALTRLREPYRQPTMLRVRHGLAPAEIALLLDRSPGTVRAQIHRGIEQVRWLLPAGVAPAMALGAVTCGRGLAAVRASVLVEGEQTALASATAAAFATSPTGLFGGFVVAKKTLTLAVLLPVAALAVLIGIAGMETREKTARPDGAPVAAAPGAPAPRAAAPDGSRAAAATAERAAVGYDGGPNAWQLHARVLDGPSQAPIAGATVLLHGPRTLTLLELQREFAALGWPAPTGGLYSRVEALRDLAREPDAQLTTAGARGSFLVPPRAGDRPLVRIATDAEGRFTLPIAAGGGMVVVAHAGHGGRQIPFAQVTNETTIVLWPLQRIVGRVRTQEDEVPREPLELLLFATDALSSGAWAATTDAAGTFTAEVAAQQVTVTSRTRGWALTQRHGKGIATTSLDVPTGGTVYVARFASARLHVTDARNGRPIETIRLLSRDESGFPVHCGRFHAPDGYFSLADVDSVVDQPAQPGRSQRITPWVWSNGYAAAQLKELPLYGADLADVEVRLEPGTIAELAGRAVRAGAPVEGLSVRLRAFQTHNWRSWMQALVAVTHTAADGTFSLRAPEGEYLLEIFGAESALGAPPRAELQRAVTVPSKEPLCIELADVVRVTVAVVDAEGKRVPGHNVAISGAGGQQLVAKTGPDGSVVLGPFEAGRLNVSAPRQATDGSWVGYVTATLDVTRGATPTVELRLPSTATIRARLVFEGEPPANGCEGFVARDLSRSMRSPTPGSARDTEVALQRDGSVPLDLTPGDSVVCITASGGRQWRFRVPANAEPGHPLVVRTAGLAYTGTLTGGTGAPVANARVFAKPIGGGAEHSAVTDAVGGFRLDGLASCRYVLEFNVDRNSSYREVGTNPLGMALFETTAVPASPPASLEVRVPAFSNGAFSGVQEIEVTGRVLDATTREPLRNAIVSLESLQDQSGGVLRVFPRNGWQYSAADGSFRLVVVRGDRYRESVARKEGDELVHSEWPAPSMNARIEHDILVR